MNGQGVSSIQEHTVGDSRVRALKVGLTEHCCPGMDPVGPSYPQTWPLVTSRLLYARGPGLVPHPHPTSLNHLF